MRILILTNFYPPYFIGGYELGCAEMAEALRHSGHHVDVLTSDYKGEKGNRIKSANTNRQNELESGVTNNPGMTLRKLKTSAGRRTGINQLWREIQNKEIFLSTVRSCRPDLIYIWNVSHISFRLIELAHEFQSPVVFYVFDDWLSDWGISDAWHQTLNRKTRKPWLLAEQAIVRCLAKFLAVPTSLPARRLDKAQFASRFLYNRALEARTTINTSKIIHWGIDIRKYEYKIRRSDQAPNSLLYVGQLMPHKGVHVAIEAFAIAVKRHSLLSKMTLTIVGGSTSPWYVKRLKILAKELGINKQINFAGSLPRNNVATIYCRHDIALVPSTWNEPFGIVLLEAMSCGLPVIGTATGGSAEILRDNINGLTFEAGNANSCASCISRLALDPILFERLRLRGRQIVEDKFTMQRTIREIEFDLRSSFDHRTY